MAKKQKRNILTKIDEIISDKVNKTKSKSGGKKTYNILRGKKIKGASIFLVVFIFLMSGVLFYMDIAPFNFEIDGNFFKYYTYQPNDPNLNLSNLQEQDFRFHMIDVWQGDCLLVELPDGKRMLIDGGKKSNDVASSIISYILSETLGLKNQYGIVTIDYVLLTHADADHCGSLDDVIKSDKICVGEVFRPMILSNYNNDPLKEYADEFNYQVSTVSTTVYSDLVKAVENEQNCITHYNIGESTISGNGYDMYFFNPTADMYKNISSAADKNNVSPIVLLCVNRRKILLTGDADKEQEDNFLAKLNNNGYGISLDDADVDFLKVGHHGGKESTNKVFLDAVKPEYALISVGESNSYGHPTVEVLNRLSEIGCSGKIYRTDKKGNIVLTIDSEGEFSFVFGNSDTVNAKIIKRALYNAFFNATLKARKYL